MANIEKDTVRTFGFTASAFDHMSKEGKTMTLPKIRTDGSRAQNLQRLNLVGNSNSPDYTSSRKDKGLTRTASVAEVENRKMTIKASAIPYEKRIKYLEVENLRLSQNYQSLYRDNQLLRGKLETGTDSPGHAETYHRLASDREALREAEATYRKRIAMLQDEAREVAKRFDSVVEENDHLQKRTLKMDELQVERMQDRKRISEMDSTIRELKHKLKKKDQELNSVVKAKEAIERESISLKSQIAEMKKKNDTLKYEVEYMVKINHGHR